MSEQDNFLGPNWLINTKEGISLYRDVALPLRSEVGIIDVHTHFSLRQIIENQPFPNIWKAEVLEDRKEYANCDHYIIQLASKFSGFSQALARDPNLPDYEKWIALSNIFPYLEGNPVHQWLHLDLKRVFGINDLLSDQTGDKIWKRTENYLKQDDMLPQALLKKARARVIFTTDDPIDDLSYHKMAKDLIEDIVFLPSFRPDIYCNIFDQKWRNNIEKICSLTGEDTSLHGLVEALRKRHDYFVSIGAKTSDHGLLEPYGLEISEKRANEIFRRAYDQKETFTCRSLEAKEFISYFMHKFCEMNQDKQMTTQIHYGAFRNANRYLYENWGFDVGGDVATENVKIVDYLMPLLSKFFGGKSKKESHLVLYPMNQVFSHVNFSLERAFPLVHHGFPWWQNDTPYVIEHFLLHAANSSLLSSITGPVCDGRKILSEGSRFEVFDRVICKVIGKLLAEGQISYRGAVNTVKRLMHRNQIIIFGLEEFDK